MDDEDLMPAYVLDVAAGTVRVERKQLVRSSEVLGFVGPGLDGDQDLLNIDPKPYLADAARLIFRKTGDRPTRIIVTNHIADGLHGPQGRAEVMDMPYFVVSPIGDGAATKPEAEE